MDSSDSCPSMSGSAGAADPPTTNTPTPPGQLSWVAASPAEFDQRNIQYQTQRCLPAVINNLQQSVIYAPHPNPSFAAPGAPYLSPTGPGVPQIPGPQYLYHVTPDFFPAYPAYQPAVNCPPNPFAYYALPPPNPTIPVGYHSPQIPAVMNRPSTPVSPSMAYVAGLPYFVMPQTQHGYSPAPMNSFCQISPNLTPLANGNAANLNVSPQIPNNIPMIPVRNLQNYSGNLPTFRPVVQEYSLPQSQRLSAQRLSGGRNLNYRTRPCKMFSAKGSCPYGNQCQFIHDENLIGTVPSATSDETLKQNRDDSSSDLSGDLSHRLCSSTPISKKVLRQAELEVIHKGKKTYRQNYGPGAGCKKPNVVDGAHSVGSSRKGKFTSEEEN